MALLRGLVLEDPDWAGMYKVYKNNPLTFISVEDNDETAIDDKDVKIESPGHLRDCVLKKNGKETNAVFHHAPMIHNDQNTRLFKITIKVNETFKYTSKSYDRNEYYISINEQGEQKRYFETNIVSIKVADFSNKYQEYDGIITLIDRNILTLSCDDGIVRNLWIHDIVNVKSITLKEILEKESCFIQIFLHSMRDFISLGTLVRRQEKYGTKSACCGTVVLKEYTQLYIHWNYEKHVDVYDNERLIKEKVCFSSPANHHYLGENVYGKLCRMFNQRNQIHLSHFQVFTYDNGNLFGNMHCAVDPLTMDLKIVCLMETRKKEFYWSKMTKHDVRFLRLLRTF
jgi:hypothetical protein